MIGVGCSVVLRRKFSASNFWTDCIQYRCTAAQYIGELCRYLLAQPSRPTDTDHCVRVMYGNGMRKEIWSTFRDKYQIKDLVEFYGATEGNANIANSTNREGAVGFISMIAPWAYPVFLIKVDPHTGKPVRDKNGLCIRCQPGEPGELVGKIRNNDLSGRFDGYVDKNATQKKIVSDVMRKGDMAFLSGDILEMDELGYLYFKDRTGDTFRWKGENVSTTEVEGTISQILKLKEAVVVGVEIPSTEGRAGLAVIVDEKRQIQLDDFLRSMSVHLPPYAIPVFLRLCNKEVEKTTTFKLKKGDLRTAGFNPHLVGGDELFLLDSKSRRYVPFDERLYNDVMNGRIRL